MAIYKAIGKTGHAQPDKVVKYLLYQSDENGKYLRKDHRLIPRTDFATVLGIEADKDGFCDECRSIAADFGVNQNYADLKYKHYIQGYNVDDSKLLTKEECHQMGVEFAKTFFPEFPVLVVTHFEQETDSGGAHWHNHILVYNCNIRTGKKLNTSGERMKEQKRYIIAQALAHGLSDRELRMKDGQLMPSGNPDRVSSAEYYDRKYHQKLADREKNLNPESRIKQHTYYTQLQELRIVIASAWQTVGGDQTAFRRYLSEVYGVQTKIIRGGEISYLHPDRATEDGRGWVRGRTLGNAYTWEALKNGNYQSHYRTVLAGGNGEPSAAESKSVREKAGERRDGRTGVPHDALHTGADGTRSQGTATDRPETGGTDAKAGDSGRRKESGTQTL